MKRQRGRNRNKNNNRNHNHNNHNRSMDSQGPDVKVRGNASTIYEKYTTLARDAKMSGNRVKAENLLQHAEHYLRLMNLQEAAKKEAQEAREKAEAERAAKRAERGETEGDDEGNDNRGSRRNRYNNRRDRDDNRKSEEKTSETPSELEVIEPAAEAPKVEKTVEVAEATAEDKPARRRKAPSRKKSDSEETPEQTIEAAE